MKMVVAVVRDEFAAPLTEQLAQRGYGATKLASTGGFLKKGQSTFLVGVPVDKLDDVMGLIRTSVVPAKAGAQGETAESGATVFVLDIARMIKV